MKDRTSKYCPRCKTTLPIEGFTPANNRYDGVQAYCKECMKAYRKESYRRNPKPYRDRARQTVRRLQTIMREAKDVPCMDCVQHYPYYVMQFDHVGDDKLFEPSTLPRRGNESALREEIAKCQVVCANCHAERTFQRNLKKGLDKSEECAILDVEVG